MQLDPAYLARCRAHLMGAHSADLIRFMKGKSLSSDVGPVPAEVVDIARELDWITGPADQLTKNGFLAADSCREYQFWLERDKQLPFEGAAPHLRATYFEGKSVLEIGSGMGVNLLAFAKAGADVCGLEPITAYAQFGAIFSEREGLSVPDVRQGGAEALPFEEDALERVLCISSHQYFDLHRALAEIARVMKPGGELIIVGATLGRYTKKRLPRALRHFSAFKRLGLSVINTLGYTVSGRRPLPSKKDFSTGRPIYPSQAAMIRWMRRAGFEQVSKVCNVGPDACFHARLRA